MSERADDLHDQWMRRALVLARRGSGTTSPNPMVGAVLLAQGKIIGEGWHRRAGEPHAEIEALDDCHRQGRSPRGATLVVTLEPCSTQGRTPPCTQALLAAGIREVVVGAIDPNPRHAGRGLDVLRAAGVRVRAGVLEPECTRLNVAFNHWIIHRTPWVTLKAGLTLDGKIATASGESRWITGERARQHGMRLRAVHDAVLVGVNTVRADDPQLTIRRGRQVAAKWRIVLDTHARTPPTARLLNDEFRAQTLIVVSEQAPKKRVAALHRRVGLLVAPSDHPRIHLGWLLRELGQRQVTSLLVEGGGEVHASFLQARLARRIAFFFAPKVLGGRTSRPGVGGDGFASFGEIPHVQNPTVRRLGPDLLLTGDIHYPADIAEDSSANAA